jgi:hypothetical protein
MGNGSPRLLRQFIKRTALVALASLGLAPSAFADDGIVAVSVATEPVAASVTVAPPSLAAPTAAPSTPASTTVTPVATPLSSAHPAVQATVDAGGAEPRVHVASALSAPAAHGAVTTRHASPKDLSPSQKPASRHSFLLRGADSSRIGAPVRGPFPEASRADSPAPGPAPRIPQTPAPAPFGFGLAGSSGAALAAGLGLLLFALAAGFALPRAPPLGRRVSLLLAAPRPYAFLLQLERPD